MVAFTIDGISNASVGKILGISLCVGDEEVVGDSVVKMVGSKDSVGEPVGTITVTVGTEDGSSEEPEGLWDTDGCCDKVGSGVLGWLEELGCSEGDSLGWAVGLIARQEIASFVSGSQVTGQSAPDGPLRRKHKDPGTSTESLLSVAQLVLISSST